ncbi:tRNA glutamyl-Q(34) synthetase GluQRS [Gimibacter soli]|uniref:tRNA glutamyl-Q(34) synthetase GluQRS n=1 Tax=Gimibacter soli TaxID=3024400 RepID=A0AAE9XPT9_9PROT|nr:tRNA glutamyl-Q(34) synthetase GluQRS [Gimibacter soli]WCL54972.1 tRNA glutamyl-Q(34) synthetase GluQRS [Gimibacter soli]
MNLAQHDTSLITRFAPSPTGHLHKGHAYSALAAWKLAEAGGGTFLMRIEDIDTTRCRDEFVAAIHADMAWLGIRYPAPVRRQSEHMDDYAAALEKLKAMGAVYPCFCTRKEIAEEIARAPSAPHGPDGALYPGTCRGSSADERQARLAAGDAHAWRLDVAAASAMAGSDPLRWHDAHAGWQDAKPEMHGDVVLARKDTPTSYHLAVTHDDALQGVTDVVRGVDLFEATHIHVLLQRLLGLPTPRYHHHPLLLDEHGQRFAKRNLSVTLKSLREAGVDPATLWPGT